MREEREKINWEGGEEKTERWEREIGKDRE